jgi:nucleoside-diphosphate-sugar epimerase
MGNKTCFVTGGSGFIGGFVIDELLRRGHNVINFDRTGYPIRKRHITFVKGDLRDKAKLQECLKSVDEVYHCAAVLGT